MVQLNGEIKKQRVKKLQQLDEVLHNNYLKSMKNVAQTVLTEEIEDDYVVGWS
jgi:tRNA A37 methylthiotransferase MiaB